MVCTPVKTIKSHTHVHRNFNEISRNVIVIHSDTESDISQETNNNIFNIVITDDAQETVDATETLGVRDNYSIHNDEINANIQSIGSVGVVNSARETVGAAETLDAHNNDSIDNSKTDVIIQSIGGVGGVNNDNKQNSNDAHGVRVTHDNQYTVERQIIYSDNETIDNASDESENIFENTEEKRHILQEYIYVDLPDFANIFEFNTMNYEINAINNATSNINTDTNKRTNNEATKQT